MLPTTLLLLTTTLVKKLSISVFTKSESLVMKALFFSSSKPLLVHVLVSLSWKTFSQLCKEVFGHFERLFFSKSFYRSPLVQKRFAFSPPNSDSMMLISWILLSSKLFISISWFKPELSHLKKPITSNIYVLRSLNPLSNQLLWWLNVIPDTVNMWLAASYTDFSPRMLTPYRTIRLLASNAATFGDFAKVIAWSPSMWSSL